MAKTQKSKSTIQSKQNKENSTGVSLKKITKKPKPSKSNDVKIKKSQILKEAVKEAKIPVKKAKGTALIDKKTNTITSKQSKTNNKKATRRYLVLAPPESPVSMPIVKSKKELKKSAKIVKSSVVNDEEKISVSENGETAAVPGKKKSKQNFGKKLSNKKAEKRKTATDARGAEEAAKKKKKPTNKLFEALPFEEDKFDAIVNIESITKIANALKELVEKEVTTKKTSVFGDYNYCLNVASFKIPSCPKRIVKLNLKHSIVDVTQDDVLIVVPDLKRGAKVEYESTIEHYTDLFREAGIENLKIMPFNQLRNEFKTFESKRKLGSTYDYYLCDGRIVGRVAGFCGTLFQKSRTTFHSVRFENPKNLKSEIEKSLRRTAYKQLSKGDLITIPIGNDRFTPKEIAENVVHIISQLKNSFPGGVENVRGMDLKINIKGTTALPIYVSTSNGPEEAPFVVGPREQRLLKLKKQANEILSKFNLTKEGDIQTLTIPQIEHKRKMKETRAALLAESNEKKDAETKPEAEEIVVPTKKAHVEPKETVKKIKNKSTTKKVKRA